MIALAATNPTKLPKKVGKTWETRCYLSKTKRSIYYLSAHPIYPSRMANKNANFQRPKLPKTSSLNFRLLRLRPLS